MPAKYLRRLAFCSAVLLTLTACSRPPMVRQAPASLQVSPPQTPVEPLRSVPASAPTSQPTADSPRQVIGYLASPDLGGRAPGTPGLEMAADYLSRQMVSLRLQPLPGKSDFSQPFTMPLATTLGPRTRLTLNDNPLLLDTDFSPLRITTDGHFSGPTVFVGYGITRPGYDDYAGFDVHGKVVMAMRQEPRAGNGSSRFAEAGKPWSPDALYTTKARNAVAHGAAALLVVSPPKSGGADAMLRFAGEAGPTSATLPVVTVTRRVADLLLTTAGQPGLAEFENAIDALGRPKSVELQNVVVGGEIAMQRRSVQVQNLLGMIPGAGPSANEFVVLGAHFDHLGRGQMGHMLGPKGALFPGADDNASGTAAVLETVQRLQAGPAPARSILVALFTAEEEGLVGSNWFVKHPPVPLPSIVAMLNLDMVGRLKNQSLLLGGCGTAAAFAGVLHDAVAGLPITTQNFEKGGLGPSDHMSFALQKIPVLFLFTGLHADYHRPTDTPEKINYPGIDEISIVADRVMRQLTTMPRQTYDPTSDGTSIMAGLTGTGGMPRASLGVVPDFASGDATAGVVISGTTPGTPAAAAHLEAGDRLTQLGAHPLRNLQDLSDALAQSTPGEKVAVTLIRSGKPVTIMLTLGQRGG